MTSFTADEIVTLLDAKVAYLLKTDAVIRKFQEKYAMDPDTSDDAVTEAVRDAVRAWCAEYDSDELLLAVDCAA